MTFDTHTFVKRLTRAGMPEEQAETVMAALRESREAGLSHLATKADLTALEVRMIKWLVPLLLGQAAVIVALVKLL